MSEDNTEAVEKDWRVKLYQLREDGQWDDKGTGRVSVIRAKKSPLPTDVGAGSVVPNHRTAATSPIDTWLVARNETDESVLLNLPVTEENGYQKQGSTIICWREQDAEVDLAFSFQDSDGCNAVLEALHEACNAQAARNARFLRGRGARRKFMDDDDEDDFGDEDDIYAHQVSQHVGIEDDDENHHSGADMGPAGRLAFGGSFAAMVDDYGDLGFRIFDLPTPEISNLEEVRHVLDSLGGTHREGIAMHVMRDDNAWLHVLFEAFHEAERQNDEHKCRMVLEIVKILLDTTDQALLDTLLQDPFFMDMLGAFEHDPVHFSPSSAPQHRAFFRESVRFRQVVPLDDDELEARIHQTFRVNFVKDVLLPRAVDDPLMTSLVSINAMNNSSIVQTISSRDNIMRPLISVLRGKCHRQGQPNERENGHEQHEREEEEEQPAVANGIGGRQKRPRSDDGDSPSGSGGSPSGSGDFVAKDSAREGSSEEAPTHDPRDALKFLSDLVDAGKVYPVQLHQSILEGLLEAGEGSDVFEVFVPFLEDPRSPKDDVFRCLDILLHFARARDPTQFRRFLLGQTQHIPDAPPPALIHDDSTEAKERGSSPVDRSDSPPSSKRRKLDASGGCSSPRPEGYALSTVIRVEENPARQGDPAMVSFRGEHGHLVDKGTRPVLLHMIVWRVVEDPDPDVQEHAAELIQSLFDNQEAGLEYNAEFERFVSREIDWVIAPFARREIPPLPDVGGALVRLVAEARRMQNRQAIPKFDESPAKPTSRKEAGAESTSDSAALADPASAAAPGGAKQNEEEPTAATFAKGVLDSLAERLWTVWRECQQGLGRESSASKNSKMVLCSLLTWFVRRATPSMRGTILRKGIIPRMLRLCLFRDKHIVLSAVRFFRECVERQEDFFDVHLAEHNILPVFLAILIRNGARNNLLGSAILELFRVVSDRRSTTLLGPLVNRFRPLLELARRNAPSLDSLIARYEEAHNAEEIGENSSSDEGDGAEPQPAWNHSAKFSRSFVSSATGLDILRQNHEDDVEDVFAIAEEDDDDDDGDGDNDGRGQDSASASSPAASSFLHDVLEEYGAADKAEEDEEDLRTVMAAWAAKKKGKKPKPKLSLATTGSARTTTSSTNASASSHSSDNEGYDSIEGRGARMGLRISTPPESSAASKIEGWHLVQDSMVQQVSASSCKKEGNVSEKVGPCSPTAGRQDDGSGSPPAGEGCSAPHVAESQTPR